MADWYGVTVENEKVTKLELGSNNLNGTIPSQIGNLTSLETLSLSSNELNGNIPYEIGDLDSLKYLIINDTQISESIPSTIGNLTNLQVLSLDENKLEGSVPSELANLTKLKGLYLRENILNELPDLSAIDDLSELYISDNHFTFEDIVPNVGIAERFDYRNQAKVGDLRTYQVEEGTSQTLSVDVKGSHNTYQWFKDRDTIQGATQDTYQLTDFQWEDEGTYVCTINNTVATELTLASKDKKLEGIYDGYTVSFNVIDESGGSIDDATIVFDGTKYEPGMYVIKDRITKTNT